MVKCGRSDGIRSVMLYELHVRDNKMN